MTKKSVHNQRPELSHHDPVVQTMSENVDHLAHSLMNLAKSLTTDGDQPLDDFDLQLAKMATAHSLKGHAEEWQHILTQPADRYSKADVKEWIERYHLTVEGANLLMQQQ